MIPDVNKGVPDKRCLSHFQYRHKNRDLRTYRDGNLSTIFFKTIRFTKLDDQMLPHLSKYPDSALSLLLFSLR